MLTERERTALLLRDVEDLPAELVAEHMNCSKATVRSHIANARIKLRRYMERSRRRRRGNPHEASFLKHPTEAQLALFAGGDLGRWERWRVARHVARCAAMPARSPGFARGRHATSRRSRRKCPSCQTDLSWNRLSQEISGNIRVGLAAGEAIALFDKPAPAETPARLERRLVVLGATVVFGIAFWTSLPTSAGRAPAGVLATH